MMCLVLYCGYLMLVCFFFFKQKTAYEMRISDWSSDVCSSDLLTTKIFEADVRTAEAEVELSEAPMYPAITLEAQSEYNDGTSALDTYEFNNQLMVRVRWNLFRGGIDRAARQEALFRLTESKHRRYRSVPEAQRSEENTSELQSLLRRSY